MILDDGATQVILPDSLEWVDEFDWSSVAQDIQPTIGGGLVISESILNSGRPITLVGGEFVWVDKSVIDVLYALVNVIDKTYTLTLADLRTFTVSFDRTSSDYFVAKQLLRENVPSATSKYTLAMKLMVV